MKRPDNTEMDRLLRRHARLGGVERTRAAARAGAHMDADEMNAYAEGALPEAARSRYMAHLADCDSCRKLVTELTLAAVASAEGRERAAVAVETAAPSKSWRERLAALFSPQALRYAAPALALFAVVIVAIIALRANREASFVARNNQTGASTGAADSAPSNLAAPQASPEIAQNHASNSAGAPPLYDQQAPGEMAEASPAPPLVEKAPADKDALPAGQPAEPTATTMAQADDDATASRETDQPTERRRPQEEEVVAAPPPPPRPAPQETVTAVPEQAGARDEEQRQAKAAGEVDGADGTIANRRDAKRGRGPLGMTAGAGAPATRSKAPAARRAGPGAATTQSEAQADTRNVGGRSFQRQGGAWVDTAYNPSRPTTNVRRNSEQYRTLVADEPGLRAIVEQLGGEVIIVWKTRAYRFY